MMTNMLALNELSTIPRCYIAGVNVDILVRR